MKLRYTDRAKDDVELAFAWYERQRRGLGFEFLDCVEIAVKSKFLVALLLAAGDAKPYSTE
ncbi:MAG: hypothetical protein J5I92_08055 [Thiogranum sp.]|nr:hypothetical protein [Thiogranum sp.]